MDGCKPPKPVDVVLVHGDDMAKVGIATASGKQATFTK